MCLQKAIEKMVTKVPKLTCAQLKRQAFDSHVECYNRPEPGVSFCKLCKDIKYVMFVVGVSKPVYSNFGHAYRNAKDAFVDCFKGEYKKYFISCLGEKAVDVASKFIPPPFKVALRLIKFGIKIYRLSLGDAEKRSIQCDNSCLAEKMITSLFEKVTIADSITWFVLENQVENGHADIQVVISDLNLLETNALIENTTDSSLNMTSVDSVVERVLEVASQASELVVNGKRLQIDFLSSCEDIDCNKTIVVGHSFQPTATTGSSGTITTESSGTNTTESSGTVTIVSSGMITTESSGTNTTKSSGANTTKSSGTNTTVTSGTVTTVPLVRLLVFGHIWWHFLY